jgi:small-conductance mechanosensitive channel
MSFFLGKSQKIFQQRFNDGVPVGAHKRFFKWAIPSVLFVQLFPLLFVLVAEFALDKINDTLMSGIKDADAVPWTKIMLAGPLFLVVAFALLFWAARGFKAIGFLAGYKIKKADPIRQKLRT